MLALEIASTKNFMKHLLSGDTFDDFLLEECTISTGNTYTIDGHMNMDFFPADERDSGAIPYAFRPWSELKSLCFDLIKGKYTPVFFKFVLQWKPERADELTNGLADARHMKALVLNIRYDNGKVILTTGTSYHTFVPNREIDLAWDHYLCNYLEEKGIGYEKL